MSDLDDKLETITSMLEVAKAIVDTLRTGETVETEADADAAIEEAKSLAMDLLSPP